MIYILKHANGGYKTIERKNECKIKVYTKMNKMLVKNSRDAKNIELSTRQNKTKCKKYIY